MAKPSRSHDNPQPPQWADRFLEWYCADELLPEIQGDLHEAFLDRLEDQGLLMARLLFIKEVLLFFRPSSFERSRQNKNMSGMMGLSKNVLKVTLRNFTRNSRFNLINGFGLILGLTCSLLILLWVHFERSVDNFHPESEQIYRAYFNGVSEAGEVTFTQGASPFALYTLLHDFDGVSNAVVYASEERLINYGEVTYRSEGAMASSSLFEVFDFPMLIGNVDNAISNHQTIFVSQTLAQKLLGDKWADQAVGTTIRIDDGDDLTIAGVFAEIPGNSSLQFDFVINIEMIAEQRPEWAQHWGYKGSTVFAKINQSVDPKSIEDLINPIYEKSAGYGVGGDEVMFFPFAKNYLWTQFEQGVASGGRIQYVRIFSGAALFLILIACINFINLSTAQSARRAKEVAIRKTAGADRITLIFQFLFETGLLVFAALVISLLLTFLLLPELGHLTGAEIAFPATDPIFWLAILALGITLTCVAGFYPAFVLAKYLPSKVLKGTAISSSTNPLLRKALVVFQFTLSAILIISTITVQNQLNLIQFENLGLDRSNVLLIDMPEPVRQQFPVLRDKLLQNSGISAVLRCSDPPTNVDWINVGYDWEGRPEDQSNYFYMLNTEAQFKDVFGIKMTEGRFFDDRIPTDTAGLVMNETALAQMGLENPIGKLMTEPGKEKRVFRILGIMEDFNFKSLHQDIEPLIIKYVPHRTSDILIKTAPGETLAAIAQLTKSWREIYPDLPLDYEFLDDSYKALYEREMIVGKLAYIFACIAILISCLGLFGLISFVALQKTKEIGIRKVLGASVRSIIGLLSRDFIKLITISVLIAAPLSYILMAQWLRNFAFSAGVQWWVYVLAGVIAICLALVTISVESLKAAMASPVDSLNSD